MFASKTIKKFGITLCFSAFFGFLNTPSAQASEASDALARALELQQAGEWNEALSTAKGVGRDVIEWHYLRSGGGDWQDFRDFLTRNADWPGLPLLARRGEKTIPDTANPAQVIDYLTGYAPGTGAGALALIKAYERSGAAADAQAQAVLTWHSLALSAAQQAALAGTYAKILAPHHEARAEHMLWRRNFAQAKQLEALLPEGWGALITATKKLVDSEAGVDAAIEAVPEALRDHPVLQYARFEWRVRRGRNDDALTLLLQASAGREALGEPEAWGDRRRVLARQMMRDGKAQLAYSAASRHGLLPDEKHYSDLEWLSGYIALRYLDKPSQALDHFNRFRMSVATPISLGRAGYWEGRALEALGAREDAVAAYQFATQFQSSFYGQLAAEKLGQTLDAKLVTPPSYSDYSRAGFIGSSVLQAGVLLFEAGDRPLAARFMRHLAESLSAQEMGQLSALAHDLDPFLAVLVAKYAAGEGVVLPEAYFPLHSLAKAALPVQPELALAIARRESEFNPLARSHVGARGLMQLMPKTGAAMAEKLSVSDFEERQLDDPVLNAQLGSAYLAQLIEEFGNNIPLVASGYNAGPSRARAWIKRYGDPRGGQIDPVDWIEHIPFRETRNYVMRVAESQTIYRARLSGQAEKVRLSQELRAR